MTGTAAFPEAGEAPATRIAPIFGALMLVLRKRISSVMFCERPHSTEPMRNTVEIVDRLTESLAEAPPEPVKAQTLTFN